MTDQPYLFGFDYDGTVGDTFKPSAYGIGVKEAIELAVSHVFGQQGQVLYNEATLETRDFWRSAPSELVSSLLLRDQELTLVAQARNFFFSEKDLLKGLVPEGKGVPLVWDEQNPLGILSELFVREKLRIFQSHIGTYGEGDIWPKPCAGFADFWKGLNALQDRGITMTTAIISSGHEFFIQNTFKLWGLPQPDILITEDDVRGRISAADLHRWVKPGPLPLELAYQAWLKERGISQEHVLTTSNDNQYMWYFGDDARRDGVMALNAGIRFGHFHEDTPRLYLDRESKSVVFGDWAHINNLLEMYPSVLQDKKPVADFFVPEVVGIEGALRRKEL